MTKFVLLFIFVGAHANHHNMEYHKHQDPSLYLQSGLCHFRGYILPLNSTMLLEKPCEKWTCILDSLGKPELHLEGCSTAEDGPLYTPGEKQDLSQVFPKCCPKSAGVSSSLLNL
uniref:Single domain-containing protein n=1 Tax=Amblyomma triste TaxID=251400 RepID=A0A023G2V7_AMBTT